MLIGVPSETIPGETRVAATPETVKKLKAQGHTLRVQSGAGIAASVTVRLRSRRCRDRHASRGLGDRFAAQSALPDRRRSAATARW